MLNEYPEFQRGQTEDFFSKLTKKERNEIEEYIRYRQARKDVGERTLKEIKRHVIHLRFILQDKFETFDLKKLREYLALLNSAKHLSIHTKNDIKINIKNFLKWKFENWSKRFSELQDIRLVTNPRNEEKINASTMLSKDDIEDILKHEPLTFWRAFFMTQYEGGLRTKETRYLKWDDVKLNVDGEISEINIYATKTKRARPVFIKDATFLLKKLKEEQEFSKNKGVYIFHSMTDVNQPIGRSLVSKWMRGLSKVSKKYVWNYLLRHSRATELYRLAKQGKISKDTVLSFMGHSKDLSDTYTHLDTKEIKQMLKDQVYKLEDMPEKQRHEIEIKVDRIERNSEFQTKLITLIAKGQLDNLDVKDRKDAEMWMEKLNKK